MQIFLLPIEEETGKIKTTLCGVDFASIKKKCKFRSWKNSTPQSFFTILHIHSTFAVEYFFALKK